MLRAGFAREAITPGRDVSLIGYDFRQRMLPAGNAGVHDPLFARVLVIEDDANDRPGVLVSLDLCIVHRSLARALRADVAQRVDTTPDRVIVACTHTHSGPYPISPDELSDLSSADKDVSAWLVKLTDAERAYPQQLADAVMTAATRASGKRYRVTAAAQQAVLGLGYNRRVPRTQPAADGSTVDMCWSPAEQEHLDPGAMTDPTCSVLELRQVSGPRRHIIFNLGAHATVMGKTSRLVSADWPGAACALIERYEPGSDAMFLFGACGDVHPWIATQEHPALIEPVARAAASMVSLLTHALRPDREAPDSLSMHAATQAIAGCEMDLAAWRIGPATLVAAPVELFGTLGLALRQQVPGPLLLATCANGFEGYWPTADAYNQGNYEVQAARRYQRSPGSGEELVHALKQLCQEV